MIFRARVWLGLRREGLAIRFKVVGVGGTFDEFHKGHKALLSKAFNVGETVVIGLSTDALVRKMAKTHSIAAYDARQKELKNFLRSQGWVDRAKIIPLKTVYGNALTSKQIEALVVSCETEPIAKEINAKRGKKGLKHLGIIVIDMVPAYNSEPISTTRIRSLEIDREGKLVRSQK